MYTFPDMWWWVGLYHLYPKEFKVKFALHAVIFAADVKVTFDSYRNCMVGTCNQRTVITTNPGTWTDSYDVFLEGISVRN